jgi:DNA-binding transcriptional MerR regulator
MRPQKEKTFSISDLRKEFNVTSRTIRYYEDISLLNPNRCGKSRIYSPADRTRLKLILRGKRLGLSLEDSRQIIDMYEPGNNNVQQLITLINAIREQRKKLNRQLDDIHKLLADLKTAESDCQQALTAISKE